MFHHRNRESAQRERGRVVATSALSRRLRLTRAISASRKLGADGGAFEKVERFFKIATRRQALRPVEPVKMSNPGTMSEVNALVRAAFEVARACPRTERMFPHRDRGPWKIWVGKGADG